MNSVGKVLPNFWRQVLVADQLVKATISRWPSASSMNFFVVHLGMNQTHDMRSPRLKSRPLLVGVIVTLIYAHNPALGA